MSWWGACASDEGERAGEGVYRRGRSAVSPLLFSGRLRTNSCILHVRGDPRAVASSWDAPRGGY